MHEVEERYRRRKYLIASDIPEPSTGNIEERTNEDENYIMRIMEHDKVEDFEPTVCSQIGKIDPVNPTLLRFKYEMIQK